MLALQGPGFLSHLYSSSAEPLEIKPHPQEPANLNSFHENL